MATDVAAVKAKIIEERNVVAQAVALIDLAAEKALLDSAQANLDQAQRAFDKKSERWTLVNDKIQRLAVLDAQVTLFS